jgi:hypothetical protein
MNRSVSSGLLSFVFFVVGIFVACLGCGQQKQVIKDRASVSGTVTFAGRPLPGGTIRFQSVEKQVSTSAMISEGGRYSTDRAPIGKNTVSVETEMLRFGNAAAYVAIPAKYTSPATSGLTADLQPGDNAGVDFALDAVSDQ